MSFWDKHAETDVVDVTVRRGGVTRETFVTTLKVAREVLECPPLARPAGDVEVGEAQLKQLAQIACEWDEDNKGVCRCAQADRVDGFPLADWCKGCVGVARTFAPLIDGAALASRSVQSSLAETK